MKKKQSESANGTRKLTHAISSSKTEKQTYVSYSLLLVFSTHTHHTQIHAKSHMYLHIYILARARNCNTEMKFA